MDGELAEFLGVRRDDHWCRGTNRGGVFQCARSGADGAAFPSCQFDGLVLGRSRLTLDCESPLAKARPMTAFQIYTLYIAPLVLLFVAAGPAWPMVRGERAQTGG